MTPDPALTCLAPAKKRFKSRAYARHIAKTKYPGSHMSAYPCGDHWHLGHLPDAVTRGRITRADLDRPTVTTEE